MTTDRPKSRSLKPLRALWPYLSAYPGTLSLAIFALVTASASMLVLPLIFRDLVDQAMAVRDSRTLDWYFLAFLVAAVVYSLFAALRYYLLTWLGERVVADLRRDVFRRVVQMDPAFFEVTRTGEVLSRLTTDTTVVQMTASVTLSVTLRSLLQLVGAVALLVATSPALAGAILLLLPVIIAPLVLFARRLRKLSRDSQDRVAETSGLAGEVLGAMQTVQAFTLERLTSRRYQDAVEASFAVAETRTRVRGMLTALATILVFAAVTFVLWQGANQVLSGAMTPGKLSQFLIYAVYVGIAVTSLSEMWGEVQRAAGAMERLFELKNAAPAILPMGKPVILPHRTRKRLVFESVSFSYPSRPETRAIDDFSLTVEPGETVAIVGASGAGKSTIIQLLLRFYDPSGGRILLGDVDIRTMDLSSLRGSIGLVPQETILFGASARENIRYGRPGATDEEVQAAAHAAGADGFIRELPEGYDSFLGERGTRLSGGQRQRIAVARAVLKDAPVLFLDEATSALDAESEHYVKEALEKLMEGRTTLVIAHRLSTIVKADRIIVLDKGRIAAIGTHGELLQNSPLYARVAALQLSEAA
jgi:ATP-binding cassette, subfamily B, bacterial